MTGTSEKRSQEEEFAQNIKVIILDIEGTTTSISYVKETLFPYVRENLKVYLKSHWKEPEFVEDLTLIRKQAENDKENGVEGLVPIPAGNDNYDEICESVLNNILWQMDSDRKTKALKQFQGHVMREGYLNGKLKGHVYDDVQPALKSWTHSGRQVYIYSSGSVAAQKLLFGHSEKGDLLEFFSGHFDTEVGPKVESASYSSIAKQLNSKSEEIMFLTDIPKEAIAARDAGLHAVLVVRPGNSPLSDDDCNQFKVIESFDDIVFEACTKRAKLSADDDLASSEIVSDKSGHKSNLDTQMEVDEHETSTVSESCEKNASSKPEVKSLQTANVSDQCENVSESKKDNEDEITGSEAEKSASEPVPLEHKKETKVEDQKEVTNSVESDNIKDIEKETGNDSDKEGICEKSQHIVGTREVKANEKTEDNLAECVSSDDTKKQVTIKTENADMLEEENNKTVTNVENIKTDENKSGTIHNFNEEKTKVPKAEDSMETIKVEKESAEMKQNCTASKDLQKSNSERADASFPEDEVIDSKKDENNSEMETDSDALTSETEKNESKESKLTGNCEDTSDCLTGEKAVTSTAVKSKDLGVTDQTVSEGSEEKNVLRVEEQSLLKNSTLNAAEETSKPVKETADCNGESKILDPTYPEKTLNDENPSELSPSKQKDINCANDEEKKKREVSEEEKGDVKEQKSLQVTDDKMKTESSKKDFLPESKSNDMEKGGRSDDEITAKNGEAGALTVKNIENVETEEKVPTIPIDSGKNPTVDATKNSEEMETDGTTKVDMLTDADDSKGGKPNPENGEKMELDALESVEVRNSSAVDDTKSNGINDGHFISSKNQEINEKVDNESTKLKKSEESDAEKLSTSSSPQI